MLRMTSLMYTFISSTIAGIFIIVVLVMGAPYDTLNYIIMAAAAGFIVALPISWYVARAIKNMG